VAHKSALIVDDSRTAREALRRMLADHELHVETAESAESALEFLALHRPDVIFMDHMMPGMDGFQAVKAIKENPATATIPVMMYTSQSGELYVGQARALGAVGVLPKQIKPVEVGEVLRSLHLLPGDAAQLPARRASDQARRAGDATGLPGVESVNAPADWSDLHRWLQEMLVDYNRALRSDLESTISRVLTEHAPGIQSAVPPARGGFWPSGALIVVLSVVAAIFIWLHLDSEAKWRAVSEQNIGLLSELNARRATDVSDANDALSRMPSAPGEFARSAGVAAALEWGVNQSATYPPTALPFGDAQLEKLGGLMDRLRALGFSGTVRLESHVGDFCMQRTSDGTWAMAANDLPASRCDRIGLLPEEARTESARQSVAFANYLGELLVGGGPIRVELEPLGNTEPLVPYGVATDDMSAGDWNRIARQNQRVEFRLIADPAGR